MLYLPGITSGPPPASSGFSILSSKRVLGVNLTGIQRQEMEERTRQKVINRLATIPSLNYGNYPTPIEELAMLRIKLGGGPRLLIKRDDFTGVAFGGNKVRKLDYVLAQAVSNRAEVAITIGDEKSNHARVTATMCAKLGLRCILVLNGKSANGYQPTRPAGIHLAELLGAEVHRVGTRTDRLPKMRSIAENLRVQGQQVEEIPLGASVPIGALGYVSAARETAAQLTAMSLDITHIFHCSTSGGTQAGLNVGCHVFGLEDVKIIGVSPDDPESAIADRVHGIIQGVEELLDVKTALRFEQVRVLDTFIGDGYGADTPESLVAMELLARTEGIFLDPVYTAKTMAALIEWIKSEKLTEKDTVLFWHTGGQMAMFHAPTRNDGIYLKCEAKA